MGDRLWANHAVDYFERITLARRGEAIKMRVLRAGFDNFVSLLLDAAPKEEEEEEEEGAGAAAAAAVDVVTAASVAAADHREAVDALVNRTHPHTEAVQQWGPGVNEIYQVYLFTTYGEKHRRLNDVSIMMCKAGFAEVRAVPQ